jgi:hypothetical protein
LWRILALSDFSLADVSYMKLVTEGELPMPSYPLCEICEEPCCDGFVVNKHGKVVHLACSRSATDTENQSQREREREAEKSPSK